MTGIYMLINKINGKCYIGQSVDIYARWVDHKTPSKRTRGTVLGRALSKYGCENFELIILEECPEEKLDEREMYYIAKYKPAYNMNGGGKGNKGHRVSPEVKKRLSLIAKQQWQAKTEEERQRIITHNLKGPKKGHVVREETRQKLRLSAKRQFANGMSDEHKRKISQALKGREKHYIARKAPVEQIDKETGEVIKVYSTTKEAAQAIGITPTNITAVCRGRQQTAGGYKWRYHHLSSVETIPQGSRAEDELPLEARGNSLRVEEIVQALTMGKSGALDKGYIQLCMRTGAYKHINADVVYEGELIKHDKLTGEIELDPSVRISDEKVGYFAFFETLNGFRKTLYMTKEEIEAHAKRFSKTYGRANSPWATDFDAMALKTVLRLLLSKYGIMSIEMQQAFVQEAPPEIVDIADQKAAGVLDVEVEKVTETTEEVEVTEETQSSQEAH